MGRPEPQYPSHHQLVTIIVGVYESATVPDRRGARVQRVIGAARGLFEATRGALACVLAGAFLAASALSAQTGERTVSYVHFRGNSALDDYTLQTSISTSGSTGALGLGFFKHLGWYGQRRFFDELEFRRDVLRVQLLYRQRGYYDTRVDTVVDRGERSVGVTFVIDEGPPVVVDSIALRGTEGVLDPRAALRHLAFRAGRPFDRLAFDAAADTIVLQMKNRGHPFAGIYRSFEVDRAGHRATLQLDVVAGPRARIGDVRIEGSSTVSPRTVSRSLAVHTGDAFSQDALYESQRSLYQTELFRYASVDVAPDSTVSGADSLVRVLVQVSEGSRNRFRLGAGYGTIDCFRTQGTWSAGGFLGGTRRLDVAAKVSKLGVGTPTDLGFRNTVCPALFDDPFSAHVNYLGSVSFTQSSLFARRNALTVSAFGERRSEFKAYERQGLGGSVAMSFGLGRDIPLTVAYRLSYGRTIADPATFCTFFDRCEQSTVSQLQERRREAAIVVTLARNHANSPIDPTSGDIYSVEFTHASPAVGSDALIVFNKAVAEAIWYQPLSGARGWVLALRLRAGVIRPGLAFVADSAIRFVPPEERFYAGGPSTVRGFGRNELGPVVYVADSLLVDALTGDSTPVGLRTSPVGSYGVALANAELRFPSPVWASRLRLAAFVDVGRVWDQTEGGLVSAGFRVTPGVGVRILTPLGPLRVDVAYNDYPRLAGPLYVTVPASGTQLGRLDLVTSHYAGPPRRQSLLGKLQFHFSVGEAF
jgi:outer membrane protein assembly complex protein YaeT